jgi:hypothetical protein
LEAAARTTKICAPPRSDSVLQIIPAKQKLQKD